jgi:hypothetical protein
MDNFDKLKVDLVEAEKYNDARDRSAELCKDKFCGGTWNEAKEKEYVEIQKWIYDFEVANGHRLMDRREIAMWRGIIELNDKIRETLLKVPREKQQQYQCVACTDWFTAPWKQMYCPTCDDIYNGK